MKIIVNCVTTDANYTVVANSVHTGDATRVGVGGVYWTSVFESDATLHNYLN